MDSISDDYMREMLKTMKPYTFVILLRTPKRDEPGADKIVWEHGRRNFELRRDGRLNIVCQVTVKGEVSGLCIFNTDPEETRRIMDGDPAIRAGIYRYEIHPVMTFPGDSLAG